MSYQYKTVDWLVDFYAPSNDTSMTGLAAFFNFLALGICALGQVPAKLSVHSPHFGPTGKQTILLNLQHLSG